MLRSPFSAFLIALLLLGLTGGAGCRSASGEGEEPTTDGEAQLLACLYFYRSHNIGDRSRPTGLLRRTGEGWASMTWKELITSGVAVDASGHWIYLAAGDGVHVSRDGGSTFRVTGGIDVMEVQGVCIDTRDPRRAWAATAYGVFHTADVWGERPWRPLDHGDQFGFANAVVQDRTAPDRLWVASESGIFLSEDEGASFRRVSADVRVRRLLQDAADPRRLLATSDGLGVMESSDGGATWHPTGAPAATVFCLAQDSQHPMTIYCGARGRIHRSVDGGRTWVGRDAGIDPNFYVFDIEIDPAAPGRVLAGGSDGLLASLDGGRTWSRAGLREALVCDVAFASLASVPADGPSWSPGTLRFAGPDRIFEEHRPGADPAFLARRERLRNVLTAASPPPQDGPLSCSAAWLEILRGYGGPQVWERVAQYMAEPSSSLFWAFDALAFYLHHQDAMPPALRDRFRSVLTTHPVYRGDTENHWVKHYATMLLAAQSFSETPAAAWYLGRNTQSIYDEARSWFVHWARLTASKGQGEFDSPHYIFVYLRPLLLLYDFAAEPEVKQLAGMMLDLILADYLSESLDGAYGGGHSRDLHPLETTDARVAALHDLYAGGISPTQNTSSWMLLPVTSGYIPPGLFGVMANERGEAWVQTEVKRVRNVIRFGDELNPPVFKYDYVTRRYLMGSLQGGILQPIQQHTWDVTWRSEQPGATLFTVHPFVSGYELAMFFPEDLHVLVDNVTAQKGIYASPDKLYSSSPFEQVFQHEEVLLALYQVPAGERFPHVDLHVPRFLEREEQDGWWFGRDDGFHVAWFATAPGAWGPFEDHDRFRCAGARAGFVVSAARPGEEYEAFRARILAAPAPVLEGEAELLTLRWETGDGRSYAKCWGDAAGTVDGSPAPVPADQLFAGRFLRATVGERVITMSAGGRRRVLDFNEFSIRPLE